MQFRLKYVPLGANEWDNPIGSCVVEPCGGEAMGAVDDDEEAPPLKVNDRREDQVGCC